MDLFNDITCVMQCRTPIWSADPFDVHVIEKRLHQLKRNHDWFTTTNIVHIFNLC